jgi:hypothetical protein
MLNKEEVQIIKSQLEQILFDLGKEIKILRIDNQNIILDVPYSEYIAKIIDAISEKESNVNTSV